MSATTTVPVTIDSDAAERIDELRTQREFHLILDHTLQTIPDLVSIRVRLEPAYDTDDDASITIESLRSVRVAWDDGVNRAWFDWVTSTFPMSIGRWYRLMTRTESGE